MNTGFLQSARALALIAAVALLGGCASLAPQANPRDPFESFNRPMANFNDRVDAALLKPVATTYRQVVPPLVRTGVSNFFNNMTDAWSGVNSLLQFRLGNAGENLMRFSINSFFGVAGIFDLASEFNIERHREDFGQTLGHWGVPAGPYLVLPFLGPSTLRDALVLPVEWKVDLVRGTRPISLRNTMYGTRVVNQRSNLLRVGAVVDEAALDRYTFTRDAYMQRRRAEVYDDQEEKGSDGSLPDTTKEPKTPQAPARPGSAPSSAAPAAR